MVVMRQEVWEEEYKRQVRRKVWVVVLWKQVQERMLRLRVRCCSERVSACPTRFVRV